MSIDGGVDLEREPRNLEYAVEDPVPADNIGGQLVAGAEVARGL
jgi:hypothetical protein